MPISNGSRSANIGRDAQMVLMGPDGSRVDLPLIKSFDSKPEMTQIKSLLMDSSQMTADLTTCWTGSFEIERANSAVDDLFASIESNWLDAGI